MCSADAAPQRRQRVAAFERRDEPAAACLCASADQLARHPGVVGLGELETRERILAVRVESRRHVDDLRPVAFERRQPVLAHRLAERVAAAAGRQRDVDHVAATFSVPEYGYSGCWKIDAISTRESPAKMSSVPLPWWTSKSMTATRSMPCASSACAAPTATLLKRQKPIARLRSAWWPGRPHRAERALALAPHHEVGGEHDGAGGVLRRRQRVRVERGVGVDEVQP